MIRWTFSSTCGCIVHGYEPNLGAAYNTAKTIALTHGGGTITVDNRETANTVDYVEEVATVLIGA